MYILPRPAIFLVTSGAANHEDDAGWRAALRSAAEAAAADVDVVQVREPNLADRALASLVRGVLQQTNGARTRVVVNDRPDIAEAAGAHGVHLRSDGIAASRVRTRLSGDSLIGRSVHSLGEARAVALDGGIDYLFFGTVFQSQSKAAGHQVQGTAALKTVCESVDVPVMAIGGVTLENVDEIAAAGAAGLAAIGLFVEGARTHPGGLTRLVRDLRVAFSKAGVLPHDR